MDRAIYSKATGKNKLTPITSEWMHSLMKSHHLIAGLISEHGSPINLHHLPSFQKNIEDYAKVFEDFALDAQIFFARKANKSKTLARAALDAGIGVDTASFKELQQALDAGGQKDSLVLTAAIKNQELIRLALENDVLIIIDNFDELKLVDTHATALGKKCFVGVRLSGFHYNKEKLYSRFGFDIDRDLDELKNWFKKHNPTTNLELNGFHFHLDGYSIEQRGASALQSMKIISEFQQLGHDIRYLDIGGGILMNYLESKNEWEDFQESLRQSVAGKNGPITFRNNGLGYRISEDTKKVVGNLETYPYYNEINSSQFLKAVLEYSDEQDRSVADHLKKLKIQVRIEPGRSLLNQVGVTIAKVAHRKQDAQGNWLVALEMNISQLKSSSADFLLDPFVMYRDGSDSPEEIDLYFTGAYCLEQDVILKRKLTFPKLPAVGDFIVFINTAGYMMHFYETEAHLFELSKNLCIPNSKDRFEYSDISEDDTLNQSIVAIPLR